MPYLATTLVPLYTNAMIPQKPCTSQLIIPELSVNAIDPASTPSAVSVDPRVYARG